MYTYKKLFRYWVIDNQRIAENSRAALKAQILYIVSLGTIEKQKKTTEKKIFSIYQDEWAKTGFSTTSLLIFLYIFFGPTNASDVEK